MPQNDPPHTSGLVRRVAIAILAVFLVLAPAVAAHAEAGPPPPVSGPQGYLVATLQGVSADAEIWVYEKVGSSWNFVKVDRAEFVVTLPPGTYTAQFKDVQTAVSRWYGGGTDASTATPFTISEESFTRISETFPGPPPIPGGYVAVSGTPRAGLPVTAVTGWDSDPSVTVTYAWKSLLGDLLATTGTFTAADPGMIKLEATGHKSGYSDTTVFMNPPLAISSLNTLVITLHVDPATGTSGQFTFSNDQEVEAPVEVKLNGATYATITVPAGTPGLEGTASVPFSDLAPGDSISAWPTPLSAQTTYTMPLWWRLTIAQSEAAAGAALPVTGEGFAPGTQVNISLHSTPITLGTLLVGADGKLAGQVVIPAGVPAGSHTLAFSVGGVMRGQAPLTITAGTVAVSHGPELAATGVDLGGIGGIAGVLLLGGVIAIAIGFRPRRSSRA